MAKKKELTPADLQQGHVYRAKKPRKVGLFNPVWDDRQILWMGGEHLQYDSPMIKDGHHYRKVLITAFLKWAGEDVTNQMPKGDWAPAE